MDPKRVLVTGATGFLGRHLTSRLLREGYDVTVLARESSDLSFFKELPVKVFFGNITDRLALLQACENKDVVYHLAGLIAYKRSDRAAMEKINVGGTSNVLDACITNKVKKVLHLSSVVTIGASFSPKAIDEDFEFNLGSFDLGYFETKRKAEQLALSAYQNDGLNVYMINPSTIYGAGDATKGSRKTQLKVAQGRFKFYPPGGVNVVHVKDVIDAIQLCLEKGQPGRRYIIAGDNLTIKELFEIIAEASSVPPPRIAIPQWALKTLGFTGDIVKKFGVETSLSSETALTSSLYHWFENTRAKNELGFEASPAHVAIKESISWMKENGLLEND